ncbi:MAG TPA: transglutaminase family protein [Gammaproteobacteria bacterium]|nr:transglutaminase family protein [Gammaproteobacteria bacterium]
MEEYLQATWYLDCDDPAVRDYAARHAGDGSAREQAVRLYHVVRDAIRYDPYGMRFEPAYFRASAVLGRERDFCIPKALLLAALARARGIPARLGFADVRNHLATPRLLKAMGTDLFVYHGYTELYLEGKWLKATPAFNLGLCRKAGIRPLEFDGRSDSIFHPYDRSGRQHMEYVRDHGSYADLPYGEILAAMREAYPAMFRGGAAVPDGDFEAELADGGRRPGRAVRRSRSARA